jgi:hypothetical protein
VSRPPKLTIVEVVTREHGERFADEWLERSYDTSAITEAVAECGVMEWPEDDRRAQGRVHDIEDEIVQRVSDQLRSAIVDTFVRVAGEVLSRERASQSDPH